MDLMDEMRAMGIRPKFMEVLTARGLNLPASLFDPYRKTGS